MKKIIFVCSGNTCRSPMAEIILKNKLEQAKIKDYFVCSRGLNVTESNINSLSKIAFSNININCEKFTPKQIVDNDFDENTIIICMTDFIKLSLKIKFSLNNNKIFSMNDLTNLGDISDPFGQGIIEYNLTAEKLNSACEILLNKIKKGKL